MVRLRIYKKVEIFPDHLNAAVDHFGGFASVIQERKWQRVRKYMGLPASSGCGSQLTGIYLSYNPNYKAVLEQLQQRANRGGHYGSKKV